MVPSAPLALNLNPAKLRPLRTALADQLSLKRRTVTGFHGSDQGIELVKRDIEALEDLMAQVDQMIERSS